MVKDHVQAMFKGKMIPFFGLPLKNFDPTNHSEMSQVSWETWVAWVPNHWETYLKTIGKLFVSILARAVPAEVFHFNMC